jgi:hypothetical protein
MNEAINTIIGMFAGIFSSSSGGLEESGNIYHNPVYVKETEVHPLPYIFLVIAVLLFSVALYLAIKRNG